MRSTRCFPRSGATGQPEVFENAGLPFDLVAPGSAENVWIIECGSASEWGSFTAFRAAIEAAAITTTPVADQAGDGKPDGYAVVYESPTQGVMEFDWHGPLVVAGLETPIADYPRYDNPFVQVPFGHDRYEVEHGEYGLVLDFATNEREARWLGPKRSNPHHH